MRDKISGQNLSEFTILLAVVAIVAILAYSLLGQNIAEMFSKSETKVSNFKPFGVAYDKTEGYRVYKAGELGGSPGAPATSCTGGNCSIDYGNFVLNGIPEDFGEIVETTGTSSGTDDLVKILASIGDQIVDTDTGDGDSAEDFKLIANLGHFVADIQRAGEMAAKDCLSDADPKACFSAKSNTFKPTDVTVPDSLKSVIPGWPRPDNPTGYSVDFYSQILGKTDLGWAASGNVSARYQNTYPSYQIMQAYNRIMSADTDSASPGYDGVTPEMQQISTELIKQLDTLNDNLKNIYFKVESKSGQWSNYDPISKRSKWDRGLGTGDLGEVNQPKTSKNTDIRSNIFCATGNGDIIGASCS